MFTKQNWPYVHFTKESHLLKMRLLKICSLLFSLGQFLLILKLIELVRGNPTDLKSFVEENHPFEERSFFLAPSKVKQKRYRLWGSSSTTEPEVFPTTDSINVDRLGGVEDEGGEDGYRYEEVSNSTELLVKQNHNGTSDDVSEAEGRLCPLKMYKGCEGGTCGGSMSSYGFPVIPVVIAIIIGIIWFFVFLFLWYFASVPVKGGGGGYADSSSSSGGYGYGASDQGGGGWSSSESDNKGGWLDFFKKGQGSGRALENFNQLTSMIVNSLSNFATLYNNS